MGTWAVGHHQVLIDPLPVLATIVWGAAVILRGTLCIFLQLLWLLGKHPLESCLKFFRAPSMFLTRVGMSDMGDQRPAWLTHSNMVLSWS